MRKLFLILLICLISQFSLFSQNKDDKKHPVETDKILATEEKTVEKEKAVQSEKSAENESKKSQITENTKEDKNLKESPKTENTSESGVVPKTKEITKSSKSPETDKSEVKSDKKAPEKKDDKKSSEKSEGKKKSNTKITILSAQKTEYAKSEEGTDEIVLTGDVKVSVEQNGTKTVVNADRVTYDRERQRLFAEGSVVLDKMSGSSVTEQITAESVLFNAENLEGVFNKGRVAQSDSDMFKLDSKSKLVVASDIFGRDDSGVIGFKNGSLTFCDAEDPHWHIDASRIWLLPGNEFAFVNARFFVGSIFTLWFPFFYYPKDEMILNPVVGIDDRKGYFLHTTTYLIGRKPLDTKSGGGEDGYLDFLRPTSLKKQVREGVFLHNLDENYTGSTSNYLKIMGDYYTKLGGFIGVDGVLKPKKVVSNLKFSLLTGFSNTLYRENGIYTPFIAANNNEVKNDKGYLLGWEVPFRFYANISMSLSYSPFSMSLSLPVYSDAYFMSDFVTSRSETMDWIGLLTDGLSNDKKKTTSSSSSSLSSYTWSANMSLNPRFNFLSPYISNLSLSSLKSSISFNSKDNEKLEGLDRQYSPNRKFFYPDKIVPIGASMNISGTLFSYPFRGENRKLKTSQEQTEINPIVSKILPPEELKEPEVKTEEVQKNQTSQKKEEKEDSKVIEQRNKVESQLQPDITVSPYKNSSSDPVSYSLTYSVNPNYESSINFDSNKVTAPETIAFSEENYQSTYYKFSSPVQLNSNFSLWQNFLSMRNDLRFTPQFQAHPYISEEYYSTEEKRNQILANDFSAKSMNLTSNNSLSFTPFKNLPIFGTSSLSWNSSFKVVDTEFTGTAQNPSWEYKTTKWDEDFITSHSLNLNLVSQINSSYSQILSLSTTLPPRLESYSASLKLKFPFVNFSIDNGIRKIDDDLNNDGIVDDKVKTGSVFKTYEFNPLKQNLNMSFFDNKLSLNQSYQYDIEDKHSDSLSFSASIWGMSLSYSMIYTLPYNLTKDKGWVAEKEKAFLPNALTFTYNTPSKTFRFWKNRISLTPGLSTSIRADMIKPTSSSFVFSPSLTFTIKDFLNITFRSTSRNDVIFRYFQKWFDYDVVIPGESNLFVDLWNSFNFGNDEIRQSSGFKLKNFSITITHDLHDWDLKADFSVSPRLITDEFPYRYDFSPYFSLSVVWKPMNAFKTKIEDEYGEITLNP